MMVVYVLKYDIHPDKTEEFPEWAQSAIKRTLAVPGVKEFRAYRTTVGSNQIVCTYEFADMASYSSWAESEECKKIIAETFAMGLNLTSELWGPSQAVPEPIRPGEKQIIFNFSPRGSFFRANLFWLRDTTW